MLFKQFQAMKRLHLSKSRPSVVFTGNMSLFLETAVFSKFFFKLIKSLEASLSSVIVSVGLVEGFNSKAASFYLDFCRRTKSMMLIFFFDISSASFNCCCLSCLILIGLSSFVRLRALNCKVICFSFLRFHKSDFNCCIVGC